MAKWTRKSIQAEELDYLNRYYIPMEAATGFPQKKLLTWAAERGVEHRKYNGTQNCHESGKGLRWIDRTKKASSVRHNRSNQVARGQKQPILPPDGQKAQRIKKVNRPAT